MGILFERSSFYVVIISIVVAFIVYWYIKYLVSYWDRHGVKSFKPSFPFGNFNASLFLKKSIGETVADIHNATKEPFIGVYGALRPILVVRDTELIHRILIKDFQHFVDRGVHCDEDYDPLSAHLFAMTGQKWKKLRSKLTPAFTSGKLKAMFTTMVECGSSFQKHIDDLVKINETIEIREIAARHSTQLVASVAFGLDIDCFTDSKSKFREYGRKALEPDLRNGIVFVLNFLFPAALKYLRIRSIKREVENFMRSVVKQNLEYREKNHVVRKDFFQLLVQLRNTGSVQSDEQWQTEIKNDGLKTMTLNEVTAQAYIFFLAGYETSSGTLSYCLFELAKNPEIQRKVREEIDRVRKEHNGEINYDSVAQMKYLDCCIDETLRKYPTVPFLNRECTKEYQIGTDVIIEKGVGVLISLLGLHYDENFFPDPEKFIPERFNEENSADKNIVNRPYLPFGDGPRVCIGMRMGKIQAKVGLVLLLKDYMFELGDKHVGKDLEYAASTFVMTPVGGLELKCKRR